MIVLIGATGFIGRGLVRALAGRGGIVVFTRDPEKARRSFGENVTALRWDGLTAEGWSPWVEGAAAVINLAGENLSSGRWTPERKRTILVSRTGTGQAVVEAVKAAREKPRVVIQASAVGFYGSRGEETLDESSSSGSGFLAQVCREWESSTEEVEAMGVRRVILRSGIVLGREGGALPVMARPFKLFAGGPLGSGRQWLSWIHLRDEIQAILFLMDNERARGVFNLVAPVPTRQRDFAAALGRALKRPHLFRVPAFVLRVMFGEKAAETLLVSQKVMPRRLLEERFPFRYPEAGPALGNLLFQR